MLRIKEKKERALGTKLFIKAERCNSPKCAMIRHPNRPGVHNRRPRSLSEFGRQFQEKQKVQITYGLNNRQMTSLFKKMTKDKILIALEKRLDRVVFLSGIAKSPRIARQLISHGHITVNSKKVTIPSYQVRKGDKITIRQESRKLKIFEDLNEYLKRYNVPEWLEIDKEQKIASCVGEPNTDVYSIPFNIDLVSEFYSR